MTYTVHTAQRAAQEHRLEDWIYAYLTTGPWANTALSHGLRLQQRWWRGPLLITLDRLIRVCGPEADMEYRQDVRVWEKAVTALQQRLTDPLLVPPLIVEYGDGNLYVRDGNHRLEAMRRRGWSECWIVIWYNTHTEFVQNGDRKATP